MSSFFRYLTTHKIPRIHTIRSFLKRPLSWPGVIVCALMIGILTTIYIGIIKINNHFLTTIPAHGGTVVEGVIGAPRLINPVIATTETDISLTRLMFSGLMKETSAGEIVPDLATSVTPSSDGLTYTFTLPGKLKWSDGKALTANDVAFTYQKRARFEPNSYWQQVTVSSPDAQTVVFTLPAPRLDFLELATLGIIPMHIWGEVPDETFETALANLDPVGSGPFRFVRLTQDNGIVRQIILARNRHYAGQKSYIDRYHVAFYANQRELTQALSDGDITLTAAATPETAHLFETSYTVDKIPSSTVLALFQLTNAQLFSPQTLAVLNSTIDKQAILDTIEYGYGTLPDTARLSLEESRAALHTLGFNTRADGTLEKNGSPIAFSIAVENDPRTLAAARSFEEALSTLGITALIKAFDPGTFQDVIQQSQYQFFFGTVKQEDMPRAYSPSIVLYHTTYPFIHDPALHLPVRSVLDSPIDRYRESNQWYMRTNTVWKIFTNK